MSFQWTRDQRAAIEQAGKPILVSAAAGSGKTAVLAQRCVELIVTGGTVQRDGDRATGGNPCGVEQLLVVTFTNAAAREMRQRIGARLTDAAVQAEDDGDGPLASRLRGELELLPRAAIGTLHSFAGRLIRRHFNAAGVDPNFVTLDGDQARLLQRQAVRDLFDAAYQGDHADAFATLIDHYAGGYDELLAQTVLAGHAMLTSVVDREAWYQQAIDRLRQASEGPLPESELGRRLITQITSTLAPLDDLANTVETLLVDLPDDAKLAKLHDFASERAATARQVLADVEAGTLAVDADAMKPAGNQPSPKHDDPAVLQLREALKPLNTFLKEKVPALLRFDGDRWRSDLATTIQPAEQVLRLVAAFDEVYAEKKADLRSLDFADLERVALSLLETDVAEQYRRQFEHVLVDEFQDINAVQDRMLERLSRGGENLFAVGDVKQSIYRFRLAEPQMFLGKLRDAAEQSDRVRIDLQQNFRSRGPLLASVNAAFELLMTGGPVEIDYADRHALVTNPDYPPPPDLGFLGSPVEVHVLDPKSTDSADDAAEDEGVELERIEREAVFIADRLRTLMDSGRQVLGENGEAVPLAFRHVAVLLRSRKFKADAMARVLRRQGIPCHSEVGTGFFAAQEVRDVLALLRLLDNARQDIPLAAVLRSPIAQLDDAADVMMRARLAAPDANFADAVRAFAPRHPPLEEFLDKLQQWRDRARLLPTAELIWSLYEDTGLLAYVAGLPDHAQREANLLALHRRAADFDATRSDGLAAFLALLASLDDAGEVGQPPVVGAGDDVVRVMSIHAAKGLEFPIVVLADLGKRHNVGSPGPIRFDRELGIGLEVADERKQIRYDSMASNVIAEHAKRRDLAEELRVLYVAMTRPREHLICVGTLDQAQKKIDQWQTSSDDRLEPTRVLEAGSLLQWVVTAATRDAAKNSDSHADDRFAVTVHTAGDFDDAGSITQDEVPAALAKMQPVSTPAPSKPAARAMRRFESRDHVTHASVMPGALGVTRMVARDPRVSADLEPLLPATTSPLGAAGAGSAMHIALAKLDYDRADSAKAVRAQVDALTASSHLTEEQAAAIDTEAIAWVAGGMIGELVRAAGDRVRREWPVRTAARPSELPAALWSELGLPAPPETEFDDSGLDRVLVRGQIDLLVPTPDGLIVVDFKTDRLPRGEDRQAWLNRKLADYEPQLRWYGRAAAGATRMPIARGLLVLLAARQVKMVDW